MAEDNVVDLPVVTTLDRDPSRVLKGALEAGLTEVVVIGFDADGNAFFTSSVADAGAVLFHLERARWSLMKTCDEMAER